MKLSGSTAAYPRIILTTTLTLACLLAASPAMAVYQCGNQKDDCQCGANNPYPCCDNGSNCTWWAWESACCNWGTALPGWGNANTWAQNAGKNSNFSVLSSPVVGSVATSTNGSYGHVAWVTAVGNGTVTVSEMNCCSSCGYGTDTKVFKTSFFNSGFVVKKGQPPPGPVCGNASCESGENCSNCNQDCGSCCGNGACDNGENCASCPGDCGSCCGNGACDNGEDCASCSKDCGVCCGNGACDHGETCGTCNTDCHCLPSGEYSATCNGVSGWALDPDQTDALLPVIWRCGDNEIGKSTANAAYSGHDGHGFSWPVPPALKDGQICQADVQAQDSQTGQWQSLGKQQLLCDNSPSQDSLWQTTRNDAAGLTVSVPGTAHLGLSHQHPADLPYAMSGAVQSCLIPGTEPFDSLHLNVTWNLEAKQHQVLLLCDAVVEKTWSDGTGLAVDVNLDVTATQVCVRTVATAQTMAPAADGFAIDDLQWRSRGWWHAYSPETLGLIVGHPQTDSVLLQVRALPDQLTQGRGQAMAWIDLPEPFDRVTYRLTGQHMDGLLVGDLLADQTVIPMHGGEHEVDGLQATRLTVRLGTLGDVQLPGDAALSTSNIKVLRNHVAQAGPWTLQWQNAWGLHAELPGTASSSDVGLALDLRHGDAGWLSTGQVNASIDTGELGFEQVQFRATRHLAAPVDAQVSIDDKDVTVAWPAQGQGVTTVTGRGQRFACTLKLLQDSWTAGDQSLTLDQLRWFRQGWWTAPSPQAVGFFDQREVGGTVILGTTPAWGLQGNATQGVWRLQRRLLKPQRGVRVHTTVHLPQSGLSAAILADGVTLTAIGTADAITDTVQAFASDFEELTLQLSADASGTVWTEPWQVSFSHFELLGTDGQWRPLADVSDENPIKTNGNSDVQSAASASSKDRGGCSAHGASGAHGSWLVLAFAVWLAARRRSTVGRPN